MKRTILIFSLLLICPARAQVDPGGLFRPWPSDEHVNVTGSALFNEQGHVKENGEDFRLSQYSSSGRWRLSDAHRLNPTLGYSFDFLDLHSDDSRLPDQLTDDAIGFATPLHQ